MVNCDVCSTFPLYELLASHLEHGGLGTMLAKKTSEGNLDATEFGNAICDPETCELLHYTEKPETRVGNLINAGVYAFSSHIFYHIQRVIDSKKAFQYSQTCTNTSRDSSLGSDYVRLDNDIFVPMAGKSCLAADQLYVYTSSGFWNQIKHPGIALKCSELYLNQYRDTDPSMLADSNMQTADAPRITGSVHIHTSAIVHKDATIGPNVSIGPGVYVGPGTRLRDCIVLDDVQIKDHAYVCRAILGWRSKIGKWSRVEGAGSYAERLGVAILGEAVVVEDEVIVVNCIVLPNKIIGSTSRNDIIL